MRTLLLFGPWDLAAWSLAAILLAIAFGVVAEQLAVLLGWRLVSKDVLARYRELEAERALWIETRLHDGRHPGNAIDDFAKDLARQGRKGRG